MARHGSLKDGQQTIREGSMNPSEWRFVLHKKDADAKEDTITYESVPKPPEPYETWSEYERAIDWQRKVQKMEDFCKEARVKFGNPKDQDNDDNDLKELKKLYSESENPKDRIGLTKVPLRLIPPSSVAHLAVVMNLGAEKYGPYNWRKNRVRLTVYLEAALRHILAVLDGEDLDEESGQPHTAHVMACMAIVLDASALDVLVDDRPPAGCFAQISKSLQKQNPKEPQK